MSNAPLQTRIADLLADMGPLSPTGVATWLKVRPQTAAQALRTMLEKGCVHKDGRCYVLDRRPEPPKLSEEKRAYFRDAQRRRRAAARG